MRGTAFFLLVCLAANAATNALAETERITSLEIGASMVEQDGRVIIRSLLNDGVARKSGVRVGDQILSVNNSAAEDLSALKSILQSETNLASLVVERNSEEMLLIDLSDTKAEDSLVEVAEAKLLSVKNLTPYAREQIARATNIPTSRPTQTYLQPQNTIYRPQPRPLSPSHIPSQRSAPPALLPTPTPISNPGAQYQNRRQIIAPATYAGPVANNVTRVGPPVTFTRPRPRPVVTSAPFNPPNTSSFNVTSSPVVQRGGWLQRMRSRRVVGAR